MFAHLRDTDGRTSYDVLADAALAYVEHAGTRILDIGCGEGALLEAVARRWSQASLCGIDLAGSDITTAQARVPAADLQTGDIANAPWPDRAFDLIFSHLVVPGVYDLCGVLGAIRRLLDERGLFAAIVADPNRQSSLAPYFAAAFAVAKHLHPSFGLQLVDEDAMLPLPEILKSNGFMVIDRHDFAVSAPWSRDFVERVIRSAYPFGAIAEETMLQGIRLFLPPNKAEAITVPLSLVLARR